MRAQLFDERPWHHERTNARTRLGRTHLKPSIQLDHSAGDAQLAPHKIEVRWPESDRLAEAESHHPTEVDENPPSLSHSIGQAVEFSGSDNSLLTRIQRRELDATTGRPADDIGINRVGHQPSEGCVVGPDRGRLVALGHLVDGSLDKPRCQLNHSEVSEPREPVVVKGQTMSGGGPRPPGVD